MLTKGECVVAGEECIWKGGVGNFIKTSVAEGFFGCARYEFDLTTFLASNWVGEVLDREIEYLNVELFETRNKITELKNLK